MVKTLLKLTVSSLAVVGLIGILHMPFARNLLRSVGGCPFPTTDRVLTASEAEALRTATLAPERTLERASARPALGFTLEETTRGDVLKWAKAQGVDCQSDRHGAGLRCEAVRASMLPEKGETDVTGELMLGFTAAQKLVSVHYLSRNQNRAIILARSQAARLTLSPLAVREHGDPSLSKPLSQLKREARYRDYLASVSATHLGSAYALSESYQAFAN